MQQPYIIRVYSLFDQEISLNILTLGELVKVIPETCHAKEIEHFRLLGSYFGNVIKQKRKLSSRN